MLSETAVPPRQRNGAARPLPTPLFIRNQLERDDRRLSRRSRSSTRKSLIPDPSRVTAALADPLKLGDEAFDGLTRRWPTHAETDPNA